MTKTTTVTVATWFALLCCPLAALADSSDLISGKFNLIDHEGRAATEQSYDGKIRLVFFGFTECPDVCPTTLLQIRRVMEQLEADAEKVQPLFISVDRKNDTLERLAAYVKTFHPSIVGLTGSDEQIIAAARSFNVTYGIQPGSESANGRDTVFHSAYVFLMNHDGQFLDVFGYGAKAETIVARLRGVL